jgi:DNA mismatch endonuclease (patch repair protein)
MRGNRKRDTKPELGLRRALHARGLRYLIDKRVGAGRSAPRPDVLFTRAKVALFLDGCYWHSCPEHGVTPATNVGYWGAKLARNRERDAENTKALENDGWLVVRIWEHEDPEAVADEVEAHVRKRSPRNVTS